MTGVQTCALPICAFMACRMSDPSLLSTSCHHSSRVLLPPCRNCTKTSRRLGPTPKGCFSERGGPHKLGRSRRGPCGRGNSRGQRAGEIGATTTCRQQQGLGIQAESFRPRCSGVFGSKEAVSDSLSLNSAAGMSQVLPPCAPFRSRVDCATGKALSTDGIAC